MTGLVAGLVMVAGTVAAVPAAVPPALQAALFRKVIAYDETIASSGRLDSTRIVIVALARTSTTLDLLAAFKALGVQGEEVAPGAFEQMPLAATVVYVARGAYSPLLGERCEQNQVLTISGDTDLVRQGAVAVGLYLDASGRPKILVHAGRLEATGHKLQPSLMALAEVVR